MTVKKTLKGPNVTEATVDKDIVLEQLQQSWNVGNWSKLYHTGFKYTDEVDENYKTL